MPSNRPGNAARERPAARATVVAWVIPHLVAHVASRGHAATALLSVPGLRGRDLDDPDARISDPAAREAWQRAVDLTGDEALGLHLAESLPAGAIDLVEYAFRSSATLEAAFGRLARYGRLLNDRAAVTLDRDQARLRVVLGRPEAMPLQPQRADFGVAMAVRLAREATGCPVVPLAVSFVHAAPESDFEHRRFFRAPLAFDAPVNEIVLSAEDAARPLVTADPGLAGVVRRRLDKLMEAHRPDVHATVASEVRRALLDEAGRADPSAARVARELAMSSRTLARRLAAEGTSFRRILDRTREEAAVTLLRDGRMGIAEIAFVLGYSEPAAFHRSFKRWTGRTPLSFRRSFRAA